MAADKLTQARIRARIRDFDIPALLDLLVWLGYRPDDISYRAHVSASPQPTLIHDIAFARRNGRDTVELTLNLGLLSCRSPLPSYFTALLTHVDTADALRELIGFLNQSLLQARCRSYRPERFTAAWPRVKQDILELTGPSSPAEVHAIVGKIFPELDVSVSRGVGERDVRVGDPRVGLAILGDCAFGSYIKAPAPGLRVTLRTRERESPAGIPWRAEAHRRLNQYVLPLLRDATLHLLVELMFLVEDKVLQLDGDSSIGYEPFPGGLPRPYRVTLFRGRLVPQEIEAAKAGAPGATNKAAG